MLGKQVEVYQDSLIIQGHISKTKDQTISYITANLSYQACSDKLCLRPQSKSVTVSFDNSIFQNSNSLKKNQQNITNHLDQAQSGALGAHSFWYLCIFLFLGGFLLNLTPCVYPLMGITISLFGAHQSTSKRWLNGFIYVVGIIISFSLLGAFSSLSGALFGALLQSSVIRLSITIVFIVLASSYFGLFDINLPQFLSSRITSWNQKASGILAHFVAGFFAGIIAAPCVGPFLLALIVHTANEADFWKGIWMFAIVGFGLGMPYLVFSILSKRFLKIPKSGHWMVSVKKIFGFVLLMVAVYYMKGFIPNILQMILFTVIFVALTIYLILVIKPANLIWKIVKWLLVLGLSLFIFDSSFQILRGHSFYQTKPVYSLEWNNMSSDALTQAQKNNQPILIYFKSDIWCAACQKLKKQTFSKNQVREKLQEFNLLQVDVDKHPNADSLQKAYQIYGVPTIILIDHYGKQVGNLVGFLNGKELVQELDKVLQLN